MITDVEIKEIRHLLKKAERPLFFYDDDPDGLSSFLLLRRYCGKGRGIVVKSSPVIDQEYVSKIHEVRPDMVFILDKPIVKQEFVDEANTPIVWIDHHEPAPVDHVKYFNPRKENDKDNRSTSHWCYEIAKQDMWIAACGILGDWFVPEFEEELIKKYPELMGHSDDPGVLLYTTELGKLVRIFSAVLKGTTGDTNKCTSILLKIDDPYEILHETTPRGKYIYRKYVKVHQIYEKLLKKAISKVKKGKLLLFTYPSMKLSFTGELSNELLYLYPDKVIVIAREKTDRVIMSMRSKNLSLPPIIKRCLEGLDGYGGGHEHACGGNVSKGDFDMFINRLTKEVK